MEFNASFFHILPSLRASLDEDDEVGDDESFSSQYAEGFQLARSSRYEVVEEENFFTRGELAFYSIPRAVIFYGHSGPYHRAFHLDRCGGGEGEARGGYARDSIE